MNESKGKHNRFFFLRSVVFFLPRVVVDCEAASGRKKRQNKYNSIGFGGVSRARPPSHLD